MISIAPLLLFITGACRVRSSSTHHHAFFIASQRRHVSPSLPHRLLNVPHHVVLASSSDDSNPVDDVNFNRNHLNNYYIQQVSTKTRALDVKVFRGFSAPAQDYVMEQQLLGNIISEGNAIDLIMKNYHEDGSYMYNLPQCEPEIYFAAMYNGTEPDEIKSFSIQNGIVGVVSAQLRHKSPLTVDLSDVLSKVPIHSSHVYVANMRVDLKMQRKGVGMALLSFGEMYANSCANQMDEKIPLVLSVDSDNPGAIRLYEKFGFQYLEHDDGFSKMILWP